MCCLRTVDLSIIKMFKSPLDSLKIFYRCRVQEFFSKTSGSFCYKYTYHGTHLTRHKKPVVQKPENVNIGRKTYHADLWHSPVKIIHTEYVVIAHLNLKQIVCSKSLFLVLPYLHNPTVEPLKTRAPIQLLVDPLVVKLFDKCLH